MSMYRCWHHRSRAGELFHPVIFSEYRCPRFLVHGVHGDAGHAGHDVSSCTTRNSRSLRGGRLTFLHPDCTHQSNFNTRTFLAFLPVLGDVLTRLMSFHRRVISSHLSQKVSYATKPFVFHICSRRVQFVFSYVQFLLSRC